MALMQVVVTHLTKGSVSVCDVDWSKPTAFILGNEKHGVSEEAVAAADACIIIPMSGFVESFNVSVAAALVMWEAAQQRIRKLGAHGDLTQEQKDVLKAAMVMRSVVSSWEAGEGRGGGPAYLPNTHTRACWLPCIPAHSPALRLPSWMPSNLRRCHPN